jgi:hypothetical protein
MKLQEDDFTQEENNALVGLMKLQEVDYCWQCSYHGGVEMLVRCHFFSLFYNINFATALFCTELQNVHTPTLLWSSAGNCQAPVQSACIVSSLQHGLRCLDKPWFIVAH